MTLLCWGRGFRLVFGFSCRGCDLQQLALQAVAPFINLHQATYLRLEHLSTSVREFWCFPMVELPISSSSVVYNSLICFSLLVRGLHAALLDWRMRRTELPCWLCAGALCAPEDWMSASLQSRRTPRLSFE